MDSMGRFIQRKWNMFGSKLHLWYFYRVVSALIGCAMTVSWGEYYSSWAAVAGGGKEDALRI